MNARYSPIPPLADADPPAAAAGNPTAEAGCAAAAPVTTVEPVTAALLYLLVQATTRGACMHQVRAIADHFDLLARQPETGALLRGTCLKLRAHWLQCAAAIEAERQAAPMVIERSVH